MQAIPSQAIRERARTDHPLHDDLQRCEQWSTSERNRFATCRPMGEANSMIIVIALLAGLALVVVAGWL